jgi:hypothetical protein
MSIWISNFPSYQVASNHGRKSHRKVLLFGANTDEFQPGTLSLSQFLASKWPSDWYSDSASPPFHKLRDGIITIEGVLGSPVSNEFLDKVEVALKPIPRALIEKVKDYGYTFVVTNLATDGFPAVNPPIYNQIKEKGFPSHSYRDHVPSNQTEEFLQGLEFRLKDVRGAFCVASTSLRALPVTRKKMVVAEYIVGLGLLLDPPNERDAQAPRSVRVCFRSVQKKDATIVHDVQHEFAHALDESLGMYSLTPAFKKAYREDIAGFTPEDCRRYSYQLQEKWDLGFQESFATIFEKLVGHPDEPSELLTKFPRCTALIRQLLEKNGHNHNY